MTNKELRKIYNKEREILAMMSVIKDLGAVVGLLNDRVERLERNRLWFKCKSFFSHKS